MFGDNNSNTNQTSKTLHTPDKSQGIENPPQPDEHVPPVEIPGRQDAPEHIPEKSR